MTRHSGNLWLAATAAAAAALLCATVCAAPAPRSEEAQSPMLALQHAKWVAEGSAHPTHVLYVFMDANCTYCHQLWLALKPYYRQGLQVRDILVGVISASSPGKAAAIFDASDPAAALRRNEDRWGQGPDEDGGIAPEAHPDDADLKAIAHNQELMRDFHIPGTPGVVFADAAGRVNVVPGLPGKTELAQIIQAASAHPGAT